MVEASAFWVVEAGRGELRSERLPDCGPDDVLVTTLASGISRGSESTVFQGLVPKSQHQVMRAPFQAGEFRFPVKYGYSSVGRIDQGPSDLLGRRVFCLFPHQDRYVAPAEAVVPIPEEVPATRAVLAANLETAVNGLWDAAPGLGDRVAVVGAGVVGTLVAALVRRIPGTEVQLIDVNPARASVAEALGMPFSLPGDAVGDADLVVHASGSSAGLATAVRLAGFEATVVELSWYGDRPVAAPLGEAFHSRRLTLRSSQVSALPPGRRARWSHRRRLDLVLELLKDPGLDALLAPAVPFACLPERMAELAAGRIDVLCQVISYP